MKEIDSIPQNNSCNEQPSETDRTLEHLTQPRENTINVKKIDSIRLGNVTDIPKSRLKYGSFAVSEKLKDTSINSNKSSVSKPEVLLETKTNQSIEKDFTEPFTIPSLNNPNERSDNSKLQNTLEIHTKEPIEKNVAIPLGKRSCCDLNQQPVKKRNKTEKKPSDEMRYDKIEHFPEMQNCVPVRCKKEGCHFKSRAFCIKCKVHLCLSPGRNCFKDFHYTGKENVL